MAKKDFNSFLNNFKTIKKQLNEAYIFDGDGDDSMMQEPPMEGGEETGDMQQAQSEEEKQMRMQNIIQHEPIIMKMREIALEGLQKYSDNPTSSLYEFFKKVFLDSDKVLTDGGNGGK